MRRASSRRADRLRSGGRRAAPPDPRPHRQLRALAPALEEAFARRDLSAGRVQSVALRLIVDREREIAAPSVPVSTERRRPPHARGRREPVPGPARPVLGATRSSPPRPTEGSRALDSGGGRGPRRPAARCRPTPSRRSPPTRSSAPPTPPFTTSTLQQEAARKLGYSARRTMQVAQRLVRGGQRSPAKARSASSPTCGRLGQHCRPGAVQAGRRGARAVRPPICAQADPRFSASGAERRSAPRRLTRAQRGPSPDPARAAPGARKPQLAVPPDLAADGRFAVGRGPLRPGLRGRRGGADRAQPDYVYGRRTANVQDGFGGSTSRAATTPRTRMPRRTCRGWPPSRPFDCSSCSRNSTSPNRRPGSPRRAW